MSDLVTYSDEALHAEFWNRLGLFLAVAREANHRARSSLGFADIREFPAVDQQRWQQVVNQLGFDANDLTAILEAVKAYVEPPVEPYESG